MLLFGIIFETSQQNKLTLCIQQQENKFKFCGRNCCWKKEIFTFLWVFLHFCEKWFLNPWFIDPNLFSSLKEEANISFVIFTKIESSVSFSTCLHRGTVFTRHMKKIHFIHSCFSEEEWKVHRRLVSPTINQLSVSSHLPIFNKNIRQIVSSLPTNSEFFDILPSMTTCTLTMFAEAALGTEWEPEAKQRYLQQMAAYVSRYQCEQYTFFGSSKLPAITCVNTMRMCNYFTEQLFHTCFRAYV